jgi:1-acyl-sn-glycerol-3-phosphate acyltransferase
MFYIKVFFILIWFVISSLSAILISLFRWRNPSNGWIFAQLFVWGASRISGVRINILHAHRLRDYKPCVYVGNHQSNIDMLTQAKCYPPRTVIIGKKELIWIPFFGVLFYLTGNIMINRKSHRDAMSGMSEALDFLTKKNISIYIYPEGTRNKGAEKLLKFKKGGFHLAVAAQVPIVPIVSSPINKFFDLKNLKIYPREMIIEVMEPISTQGLKSEDVPALAEKVQSLMQAKFDELRANLL